MFKAARTRSTLAIPALLQRQRQRPASTGHTLRAHRRENGRPRGEELLPALVPLRPEAPLERIQAAAREEEVPGVYEEARLRPRPVCELGLQLNNPLWWAYQSL